MSTWPELWALEPNGTIQWHVALGGYRAGQGPIVGADGTVLVSLYQDDHFPNYQSTPLYAFSPAGALGWAYMTTLGSGKAPVITADGRVLVAGGSAIASLGP